jgi:D-sedoheptulose 7-phosphate isomerase
LTGKGCDTLSTLSELIQSGLRESIAVKGATLEQVAPAIEQAAQMLIDCYRGGHKVLVCGNGGSAADAQHFEAEMVGRFLKERRPLPAMALHTNSSTLTAIGNDYGYEETFTRPVAAYGQPGDVLLAISTSGNAANVCAAVALARQMQMHTIGLTGHPGGRLAQLVHLLIAVPSTSTPRIQEAHVSIIHLLCQAVEEDVFPG